jgi:hypothetical protein
MRLFPDIDGNDLVGEPSLLEHHSRLVAVVRRPRVTIDHFILPINATGRGLPHVPPLHRFDNPIRAGRDRTLNILGGELEMEGRDGPELSDALELEIASPRVRKSVDDLQAT